MCLLSYFLGTYLLLPAQIFDDAHFREVAAKGLKATYDCAFERANVAFMELREDYPSHPAPLFLMATNRWWQSYMSTTTYYHPYIDSVVTLSLTLNDATLKKSTYQLEYNFFAYMGHALHARLATLRQEWFAAANRGRKALPYLGDCLTYTSESPEFFFAAGIYHYYAETYPQDHFYVRPFMIFFPNGNAALGVEELEQAVAVPNFTRMEAMYYLSYIYLEPNARDEAKALRVSSLLYREHPKNPWFACEYARVRVHLGQHQAALPTLDSLSAAYQALPEAGKRAYTSLTTPLTTKLMVRVEHYRGLCYLDGLGDDAQAMAAFESSLALAQLDGGLAGTDYLAANHFYLGNCYARVGRIAEARTAYEQVIALDGNERYEKRARKALASLTE
jgi:tetratricopeptide (TPR) repeat protein